VPLEPRTLDITVAGPDSSWCARLVYRDEIRFGPPYYKLGIGQLGIGRAERDVWWWSSALAEGADVRFSSDGRRLTFVRWRSLAEPCFDVVEVDLSEGTERVLATQLGSVGALAKEWDRDDDPSRARNERRPIPDWPF
jgi:hypothetical protein